MISTKKRRPLATKLRSGLHRPTQVIRPKDIYSRPTEKKKVRREVSPK